MLEKVSALTKAAATHFRQKSLAKKGDPTGAPRSLMGTVGSSGVDALVME